jgi:hypothetical protein
MYSHNAYAITSAMTIQTRMFKEIKTARSPRRPNGRDKIAERGLIASILDIDA